MFCVSVLRRALAGAVLALWAGSAQAADHSWSLRSTLDDHRARSGPPPAPFVHDDDLGSVFEESGDRAFMLFGGAAVSKRLKEIAVADVGPGDIVGGLVGLSYSQRLARYGGFSLEGEVGVAFQATVADEPHEAQGWAALFLRYDDFPWNHIVRTSVALSTGVNFATRAPGHEIKGKEGHSVGLLHYLAPEITFAAPSRPNQELVGRIHHRSPAWGTFGCQSCAANYVTVGLRSRF